MLPESIQKHYERGYSVVPWSWNSDVNDQETIFIGAYRKNGNSVYRGEIGISIVYRNGRQALEFRAFNAAISIIPYFQDILEQLTDHCGYFVEDLTVEIIVGILQKCGLSDFTVYNKPVTN